MREFRWYHGFLIALSSFRCSGRFCFWEERMEQYIFAPTACKAGLEEELAAALEKRMEIFSRTSLPGMWKKRTPSIAMRRGATGGKEFYGRSFRGC